MDDLEERGPSSPLRETFGLICSEPGRSPLALALRRESTPSEMTPTLTPLPVRPLRLRSNSARCMPSPSVTTRPALVEA